MTIQLLSWDTAFFKMKIGAVFVKKKELFHIEPLYQEAKKNKFQLIYIESESSLAKIKTPHGVFALIDRKTTLRRNTTSRNVFRSHWEIIDYQYPHIHKKLKDLAYASGTYSRFHIDPIFPDVLFKKLYRRWLSSSVNHQTADVVFVCLSKVGEPIGFITVKKDQNIARIGLLAVDKDYRKKHIGSDLLEKAIIWSNSNHCTALMVITQYQNKAAINFYRQYGFVQVQKTYMYHYWINKK